MTDVDIDAYVYTHKRSWDRLDSLARTRRLSGAGADELIGLYQRTSLQLAAVQSQIPDPGLVRGLSAVLVRARIRIGRRPNDIGTQIGQFFLWRFPAAACRASPWWSGVAALFVLVSTVLGWWIDTSDQARHLFGIDHADDLTRPGGGFETYYYEHPHGVFTAQVWTNNAWVAAGALFTGILILPALGLLINNAINVAIDGGLMAHAGRLDVFFGYLLPHGMLELTAIFLAGGAGLKLGWTLIDPGHLSRAEALARQGRDTVVIALGLTAVLLVSGILEGFVTPSGLPTMARIAIGATVEAAFLTYVAALGRGFRLAPFRAAGLPEDVAVGVGGAAEDEQ